MKAFLNGCGILGVIFVLVVATIIVSGVGIRTGDIVNGFYALGGVGILVFIGVAVYKLWPAIQEAWDRRREN
jgi:hypothetical protein